MFTFNYLLISIPVLVFVGWNRSDLFSDVLKETVFSCFSVVAVSLPSAHQPSRSWWSGSWETWRCRRPTTPASSARCRPRRPAPRRGAWTASRCSPARGSAWRRWGRSTGWHCGKPRPTWAAWWSSHPEEPEVKLSSESQVGTTNYTAKTQNLTT